MQVLYVPSRLVHGVSVVCRQDCRFLLVKRKNPPFQGWFSFPGGKVRSAEHPHAAAKREFLEETGLTVTKLAHFATLDMAGEMQQSARYYLSVYQALATTGTARAGDDALLLTWATPAQMQQMRDIPSVTAIARQLAPTTQEGSLP